MNIIYEYYLYFEFFLFLISVAVDIILQIISYATEATEIFFIGCLVSYIVTCLNHFKIMITFTEFMEIKISKFENSTFKI